MSAERPTTVDSAPDASSASAVLARVSTRPATGAIAVALAGCLLLTGIACRELLHFQPGDASDASFAGEVEEWFFEPSDSSPLVVLALCGWLLWRRRRRLAALWGRPGSAGATAALWGLAAGIFAWAVRAGAPDLQAVALIPALVGAGHLLGGRAAARVVAVPAAVLLFAVPLPAPLLNQIVWRLQIWTADFTGFLLHVLGFPALVSGDRIIMSDGLFAIIETCSGMRSIQTLALLSILMIELFRRRGAHAIALLAVSPFIAFLINGLRCLGLIFNPHADIASVHNLQGIAMLLAGVLLLYFIDGLMERFGRPPEPISSIERRARTQRASRRAPLAPRVAVLGAFCGLLFAISWLPRFAAPELAWQAPPRVVALELEGWRGAEQETDWMFLGTAGFGSIVNRRYTRGRDAVGLFLGQAGRNGRARSYLSPKAAYPGSGWIVEREEPAVLAGRDVTLRVLRKGASRMLAAHWFEASPGLAGETARALLALDSTPFARPRVPMAVRLTTPLASTDPRAVDHSMRRLDGFGHALRPLLERLAVPGLVPRSAIGGKLFSQNG